MSLFFCFNFFFHIFNSWLLLYLFFGLIFTRLLLDKFETCLSSKVLTSVLLSQHASHFYVALFDVVVIDRMYKSVSSSILSARNFAYSPPKCPTVHQNLNVINIKSNWINRECFWFCDTDTCSCIHIFTRTPSQTHTYTCVCCVYVCVKLYIHV